MPEFAFGSRFFYSPFFEETIKAGAKTYSVYNRTAMATEYESAAADYAALTTRAALWDVGAQRQIEIRGDAALAFAQYLTPRDLSASRPGRCRYVLITDDGGGVINDPVLLHLAPDRLWLSAADSDLLLWCRGVNHGKRFAVEIADGDAYPLQLQGPAAPQIAADVFGDWIHTLNYFDLREREFNGMRLVISRTGWSCEKGYEIYLRGGDVENGAALWGAIMAAGEKYGIAPGGPSAIRRIEGGLISCGADATPADNPFELGLARLVNLGGHDFIGRAALEKIKAEGAKRRLCGLVVGGSPLAAANNRFWRCFAAGGAAVGEVRSAIYSPRLGRNIALAMLDIAAAPGAKITVAAVDGAREAEVCDLPFVPSRANP